MAIRTHQAGEIYDAAGNKASLEYDYDDVDLRIRTVRCINGFTRNVTGTAIMVSNQRTYTRAFVPGTTELNIPTGPTQRLQLFVDARGRLDGVEVSMS